MLTADPNPDLAAAIPPFVSVVVPVLDDTEALIGQLDVLAAAPEVQVIVVLGAAPNAACRALRAARPDVTWVESAPGRGTQMNRGAACATGRWLVFLHADVRLPAHWLTELERLDPSTDIVGGSFRFTLDSPHRAARVIESGVAARVRWLGLPYGDQALFARRVVFESMEGFREFPLMEDVDFVRRLSRLGRLAHLAAPVRISARRWEKEGWVRRSAGNVVLLLLFALGVSTGRLARWYYPERFE